MEYYTSDVPQILVDLFKMVMANFYSIEASLIINILIRNPVISEDELVKRIKLTRAIIRSNLECITEKEKWIQKKIVNRKDGKPKVKLFYFIRYRRFVNVVKVKLLLMEEALSEKSPQAGLECLDCRKFYKYDYANQLLHPVTGEISYIACQNSNIEDSTDTTQLPPASLVRFKHLTKPILSLLDEIQSLRLPDDPIQMKSTLKPSEEYRDLPSSSSTASDLPSSSSTASDLPSSSSTASDLPSSSSTASDSASLLNEEKGKRKRLDSELETEDVIPVAEKRTPRDEPFICVGDDSVSFLEVNMETVARMTENEKITYHHEFHKFLLYNSV